MLQASATLASSYLTKEAAERRLVESASERDRLRQERQVMAQRAQAARNAWRSEQEQAHARELEVNDLRHRRATLVDRLREDYQIDLAEVYQQKRGEGLGARSEGLGARSEGLGVRDEGLGARDECGGARDEQE